MHLHHIAVQVTELARAAAFYRDFLGLKELRQQPHALWLAAGSVILMLERCEQSAQSPWRSPVAGLHLLALQIEASERDSWKRRLQEANIPLEAESDFTLYLRDPDGNRLGLSHYPEAASSRP